MIKDGKQYIEYSGNSYQCSVAGYVNPIQHKWRFIIDGCDSGISSGEKFIFLNTEFTTCLTVRENGKTTIEAWII